MHSTLLRVVPRAAAAAVRGAPTLCRWPRLAVPRRAAGSVVEELVEPRPSPVPVTEGEILLYDGGWATKKTVLAGSMGAFAAWAYAGLNGYAAFFAPSTALMSPAVATGFIAFAGLVTAMSYGGARAAMRAAVLTRDGMFVRLYGYSPLFAVGGGTAAPVTVPLRLVSLSGSAARRPFTGVDATTLHAGVAGSVMQLTFDKPAVLQTWVGGEGSGLVWGPRGLLGAAPAAAAPSAAGAPPPPLLTPQLMYGLPTAQREAMRRYALLVHVLRGNAVDARRAASGDWELEAMCEQLDPASAPHRRAADARVDELRYWRRATDDAGRVYWYHLVTWNRQWVPPTVDGRGPVEWHPDLFGGGVPGASLQETRRG